MYPEKFVALGLSENVLQSLAKKGFEEPSPIQEACIPLLLSGDKDIIGQAQTGTGKTAAFGIPLVERLDARKRHVQAIVLTPTRELALQVAEEINSFTGRKRLGIAPIYGGASMGGQIRALKSGAHIVVGTPGRIMDHLRRGTLKIDNLDYFVLDEADEMLNMGFLEDIEQILTSTNDDKKMLFFSATMPKAILKVAKTYMGEYDVIKTTKQQITTSNTEQLYLEVDERDKFEALSRILDKEGDFYGIVFCRTKRDCENVGKRLSARGYSADALHGDVSQSQRERVLEKFKQKRITVLVATDVAARGIDVNDLNFVINYTIPQDPESYTHRVGRTGRAGRSGTAITFITPKEYRRLVVIKKVTNSEITKQSVPTVADVIESRKKKVFETIETAVTSGGFEKYEELATKALGAYDHETLVRALLKLSFAQQLEEKNYGNMRDVSVDAKATTRLFIALGRSKGYDARKIVDFVKDETGLSEDKINDVKVLEDFSFVSLPFEDGEMALHVFERKKSGGRSLVSRAKERGGSGGGNRRGGGRGGRGGYNRGGNRSGSGGRRNYRR